MATRTTNTVQERLLAILKSVQDVYSEPDATDEDFAFVGQVEDMIRTRIREPFEKAKMEAAEQTLAGPAPPGMGAMPMGEPPIPLVANPPTGAPPGGGPARPGRMPAGPNPDELRRVLTGAAGG